MTPPQEILDPNMVLVDSLFVARELALNLAPIADHEQENSPQATELAGSIHNVLKYHFVGGVAFIKEIKTDSTHSEEPTTVSDVSVAISSFTLLVEQRRDSRRMAAQARQ